MAEIYINGAQSTDYHPHPALHGFSHRRQKAARRAAQRMRGSKASAARGRFSEPREWQRSKFRESFASKKFRAPQQEFDYADVHRTSAFGSVRIPQPNVKKKTTPKGCGFLFV